MAQITLASSDAVKILDLMKQFFPTINVDEIEKAITGVKFDGSVTITKTISPSETLILKITGTPD